jgi:DNA-binding LacI/PurR family transcriptional regulator
MTITIKDIARTAKVSHSTVSRALGDHPGIPPETTARIKKIAVQMGYVPSAMARGLKTNRSQVLGVIVSRIDDPFFSEVLQGIEDVFQESGYSLFVAASNRDVSRERAIARAMLEHRVDGLIVGTTQFGAEHYKLLRGYGLPIVAVGNRELTDSKYTVCHDDLFGSREVARLLITLGHRNIAFLGNRRAERTTAGRLKGLRQELRKVGISLKSRNVFITDIDQIQGGEAGARYFLGLRDLPTAIVCFNDMMAIGVLKVLRAEGVHVPGHCSVVGFDNIPFAAYTEPALTTFEQPKYQLGYEAARMMQQLLLAGEGDHPAESQTVMLRGKLIVRETTTLPGR